MLQVRAEHKLELVEGAIRNAAQRHGANVLSVMHLGHLLREKEAAGKQDAIAFTVCQPELSADLLAADIRFAAFVPCRVTAIEREGAVMLEALSPADICRLIDRPDLSELAGRLDTTLRGIMEDAARPRAAHGPRTSRPPGTGATEDQVNPRGSIPQRIDCHGTKVEDIAGTGRHDAAGG